MLTSGWMPPASVIASWLNRLSLAISLIADAARVITCTRVDSFMVFAEKPNRTLTSLVIPPALATRDWFGFEFLHNSLIAPTAFS